MPKARGVFVAPISGPLNAPGQWRRKYTVQGAAPEAPHPAPTTNSRRTRPDSGCRDALFSWLRGEYPHSTL